LIPALRISRPRRRNLQHAFARQGLRRYLRLAEHETEWLSIARYDEMIHMWPAIPRSRLS